MKKTIILIILGIVTVGCIIFGTAYHVGGSLRLIKNPGHFITNDDETGSNSMDQSVQAFSKIKINSSVMQIIIEEGDSFSVRGSWNKNWLRPELSVNNGVLDIQQHGKKHNNTGTNNCRITITVPSNTRLNDIDIDSNVGEIKFRSINSDEISIKLNVGEISMRDVSFDNVDIDNNVGEISVYTPAELDDYDISLSTDVGEVNVNGKSYKRSYNQNGNRNRKIKIDTNVGEINLK